jgi:energy-coupling factor transporter transmembrane protein EcfT
VAVAMESRGFRGRVAGDPKARTYYLDTPIQPKDGVYLAAVVLACLFILIFVR